MNDDAVLSVVGLILLVWLVSMLYVYVGVMYYAVIISDVLEYVLYGI